MQLAAAAEPSAISHRHRPIGRIAMAMVALVLLLQTAAVVASASPARAAETTGVSTEAEWRAALADASPFEANTISLAGDITFVVDPELGSLGDPTYGGGDQPLTIKGNGFTIDASGASRVLSNGGAGLLRIEQLGVTNGKTGYPNNGGAVATQGDVVVEDSTFTDNSAPSGGGGALWVDGDVSVIRSTFTGNSARNYGGGIYARGDGAVVASTFASNFQVGGGGIAVAGDLVIEGSTFRDQRLYVGAYAHSYTAGAAATSGGSMVVVNSTIDNNDSGYGEGGTEGGALVAEGPLSLEHVTMTNNMTPQAISQAISRTSITSRASLFLVPPTDSFFGAVHCKAPLFAGAPAATGYNWSVIEGCGPVGATDQVVPSEAAPEAEVGLVDPWVPSVPSVPFPEIYREAPVAGPMTTTWPLPSSAPSPTTGGPPPPGCPPPCRLSRA